MPTPYDELLAYVREAPTTKESLAVLVNGIKKQLESIKGDPTAGRVQTVIDGLSQISSDDTVAAILMNTPQGADVPADPVFGERSTRRDYDRNRDGADDRTGAPMNSEDSATTAATRAAHARDRSDQADPRVRGRMPERSNPPKR